MEQQSRLNVPERLRMWPVYSMGFFCLSIQPMMSLLIPLWALSLDASPLLIGLSVSAGSILPALFSINSGAVIDRLGSKAVLRYSPVIIAVIASLYALFPFISVVIVMQLFFGFIQSMSWISAQTHVAKLNRQAGNNHYASTFSFAVSLGSFCGPLVTGLAWDFLGPWAAFTCVSAWCLCLWLSALLVPMERNAAQAQQSPNLKQLLPDWRDYRNAIALLAIPAVVVVIYGTFMRLSSSSIRSSFYLVFLDQIHFSASAIATIVSVHALAGTFGSLAVPLLSRYFQSATILFAAVAISIMPFCIVPLFTAYWSQFTLMLVSGFGLGMTLPVLIAMLGNAVSPKKQGIAIGLRTSANYTASFTIPLLFGIFVQMFGLTSSFYIIGALLLVPMLAAVPLALRNLSNKGTSLPQ